MNKTFRYNRAHHARKSDLKSNLADVFDRSCIAASPQILSHIEELVSPMRNKRLLPRSVRDLLLYPELYEFEDEPDEVLPEFSDYEDESDPGSEFESGSDIVEPVESVIGTAEDNISDDDGADSTDDNKNDELFDEKNRKNSLDKDEKSESNEQKDHEIGFYMHLKDDFSTNTMVKEKGDHYLFHF